MVVALIGIIAAIAVPVTGVRFRPEVQQRLPGPHQPGRPGEDARLGRVTAAWLRANIAAGTFALERWDKTTNTWATEGSVTPLSPGVTFGFGTVDRPTQYPDRHRVLGGLPRRPHGGDGHDREHRLHRLQLARPARRWRGCRSGVIYLTDGRAVAADRDRDAAHPALVDAAHLATPEWRERQ